MILILLLIFLTYGVLFIREDDMIIPYEFNWIKELGTTMIDEILITSGGVNLANYSGEYLSAVAQRDYTEGKKKLWDKMTGNVKELYDPANANGNTNVYPNAHYINSENIEPSIRGRKIYIPLEAFFCENSKLSLPLVALQYQEIQVRIIFRPLYDLFTINAIKDVTNSSGISYRARANPNDIDQQMYRFLQPHVIKMLVEFI